MNSRYSPFVTSLIGQRVRLDQRAMTRQLVVETEVLAARADFADAAVERDEVHRRSRIARLAGAGLVRGQQRIAREQMLDVREHQLLVLLLVIDADRGDRQQPFVFGSCTEELLHVLVDVLAILPHFLDRRTREQPALRTLVHAPHGLVIGIEQVFEIRMKRAIAGQQLLEQELFEEPAGVREMPLGRARVRHALHDEILRLQRRADFQRDATDVRVAGGEDFCGAGFREN